MARPIISRDEFLNVKILFLAHRVPFPPDKGERIRAFYEIVFLARQHQVDLFSLARSEEEVKHGASLKTWCQTVTVCKIRKGETIFNAALSLMRREPLSLAFFRSQDLRKQVLHALARERYDLIFVYCSSMAQYLPDPPPCPVVVDFVDTDSAKWAQYAQHARFPMSLIYAREAQQLSRLELRLLEIASHSIIISAKEAKQLSADDRRIKVVGNGVETAKAEIDILPEIAALEPYVVFVGTMDYLPNVDAVTYFARDIFPLLRREHPSLKFVVVGRNPSRRVRDLSRVEGIVVTGTVPNVQDYLRRAQVAVAPFRVSQGIHNKILEAVAAGVPIVCTSAPAEGLPEQVRKIIIVSDGAEEFSRSVSSLLCDQNARKSFAELAKPLREELDWNRVLSPIASVIEDAVAKR